MTKFSKQEIAVVTEARATNPTMSQRGLAAKLHTESQWSFNVDRTLASIYSAVRRTDRNTKLAAAKTTRSRRTFSV